MKRQAILLVGLVLVLGSIPVTTARHLSAGYQDDAGQLEITETPGDPSVPGTEPGSDTPYGRLTSTDCFDPQGNVSTEEAQQSATADGACGKAAYHVGTPKQTLAATDQDIRTDGITYSGDVKTRIGDFDVVRSESIRTMTLTSTLRALSGFGGTPTLEFCVPLCPEGSDQQPAGGEVAWDAVHTAGSTAGLTHDPGTAREKAPSDRGQRYAVNTYVRSASLILQDQANVWEMNGWSVDTAEFSFVAFLQDKSGDVISQSDLNAMVAQANELDPSTAAQICAFSPNFELTTISPGDPGTRCELPFRFREADDGSTDFKDGYNDRCKSPTYVCGSDAAWYAEFCVCPVEGNTDYEIWHHVVAPHNSDCQGQVEPNFDMSGDGTGAGSVPYLAHDLDVYTPVSNVKGVESARSVPTVVEYEEEIEDRGIDLVESQIPDTPVGDDLGDVTQPVTTQVQKDDRLEQNAKDAGDLSENSRVLHTIDRDIDPCAITFSSETKNTVDPWVNLVDSGTDAVQDVDQSVFFIGAEESADAYGNDDPNQDKDNRPGPSVYKTKGKVGMFTDRDDDATYDQIAGGQKYEDKEVSEIGAYPMFWDMWVDENGEYSTDKGCSIQDKGNLPQLMRGLGYTSNTGLVQAIYLQEPTTFVTEGSGEIVEYPTGNNIYLLLSQSARHHYTSEDGSTFAQDIDNLVDDLKAYADQKNGDANAPDVELPGDRLGLESDFNGQCTGSTGNFDSKVQFAHDCSTDCSGDTIATMYRFELENGKLDGSADTAEKLKLLPRFEPGDTAYDFGTEPETWIDVDPFDNNPDRNLDEPQPPAPPT